MEYENVILQGDSAQMLRTLPEKICQTCITSPPYWGLRDYGHAEQLGLEKTPEEYVRKLVEIFSEVKRVLRDDGVIWLNLGDSYAGSWGAMSYAGSDIAARRFGADGGKIARPVTSRTSNGLKPKDLVGIPWMVAFALRADGWYLRSDVIWAKPNPMPESVTDRPTKSHEYIFLLSKSQRYYYDADAIKEPASYNTNARVSRVKMEEHKSAPTAERNGIRGKYKTPDGWDTTKGEGGHGSIHKEGREKGYRGYKTKSQENGQSPQRHGKDIRPKTVAPGQGIKNNSSFDEALVQIVDERNKRTVWTVATQPYKEAHFATYPEDLITPCILAGCPESGIVLDPFFGSGTTGAAAKRFGRKYIGIELNPEYVKLAERRIAKVPENLFVVANG